jgi:hypothetical protein
MDQRMKLGPKDKRNLRNNSNIYNSPKLRPKDKMTLGIITSNILATLDINSFAPIYPLLHPLNMDWKLQIAAMRFVRYMCMYIYMYTQHHDTITVPWEEPSSTIKPTHYWVLLFCCWGGGGGRSLPYVWECGLVVTSSGTCSHQWVVVQVTTTTIIWNVCCNACMILIFLAIK